MSRAAHSRQSRCCRRGRIQPDGYALNGRPWYKCSAGCARGGHAYGLEGYDWDRRSFLATWPGEHISDDEAARRGLV